MGQVCSMSLRNNDFVHQVIKAAHLWPWLMKTSLDMRLCIQAKRWCFLCFFCTGLWQPLGTNILPKFCTQTHNTNLRVVAVSCTCTLTNSEQQSEYTKSNPPTEIYSIVVVPRLRCTKYREYKHFLLLLSILLLPVLSCTSNQFIACISTTAAPTTNPRSECLNVYTINPMCMLCTLVDWCLNMMVHPLAFCLPRGKERRVNDGDESKRGHALSPLSPESK